MPVMWEEREKQTNKHTLDEFHGSFYIATFFSHCWFTTSAMYSNHAWSLFGANIG